MSTKILHALCAMLLQITIFFSSTLISAFSSTVFNSIVTQQEKALLQTGRVETAQVEQIQSRIQFEYGVLSIQQPNRIDPLFCSVYAYFAFVVFNRTATVFKQVYQQMLGLKVVFQHIYFALKRYALLLHSRQPLPRFKVLY